MVEMAVHRIGMNQQGHALVILADMNGARLLPIVIGTFEAHAIAMEMRGEHFERPLTHDLFIDALEALGHSITRVEITRLENSTFYGLVFLSAHGTTIEIDARPSDAIALALRAKARILVAEGVLQQAQVWAGDLLEETNNDEVDLFRELLGKVSLSGEDEAVPRHPEGPTPEPPPSSPGSETDADRTGDS
jgi:uncharacterized protein